VISTRLANYLPRGNLLDDAAWHRRHKFLMCILGLHVPALFVFALWLGHDPLTSCYGLLPIVSCMAIGAWTPHRRVASFFICAGLVYCSAALVVFSRGSIEAHFHFFIIIGFIALYQDWVPFLWNIVFTVLSHGLGTLWQADLIFNHPDAQVNPWTWAIIHGVAVLFACVGLVIFWRTTEDEQQRAMRLATQLTETELSHRRFTSELLVNLARRNQSMLYRQLDIINELEHKERDPDALGELFRLDHLATRIRRNAESLLVLSGEEAPRIWREPVALVDVVRAAIAETEHLDRVSFSVDEQLAVVGHCVADLTHVLAELTENAVRFSPPEATVTIRTRRGRPLPDGAVITIEDWGVGMPPEQLAEANELLAHPRDLLDPSVSQRLGLHVVARLAARHGIRASLSPTPGCGVTAVVNLPEALFTSSCPSEVGTALAAIPRPRQDTTPPSPATARSWPGWWAPAQLPAAVPPSPAAQDPRPDPRTAPARPPQAGAAEAGATAAETHATGVQLSRRVPQANLAPELRRGSSTARGGPEPTPARTPAVDARSAREALSRYQASRQAAQQRAQTPPGSGS
jgi:signal transduction histidine kinase